LLRRQFGGTGSIDRKLYQVLAQELRYVVAKLGIPLGDRRLRVRGTV
jgi:hypothetical protein